jgi:signal peptidase II
VVGGAILLVGLSLFGFDFDTDGRRPSDDGDGPRPSDDEVAPGAGAASDESDTSR